ncbi:MAG: hypothetical protein D3924_03965, partial [Candidatus Electrothrix sp. AR4]|nr:hypothetical protein [Candidatus Electrothrix sp. AR4]
ARLEPEGTLTAQDAAQAIVQADYLYGSPGSDLRVQARMSLQYDPHPFADFAGFSLVGPRKSQALLL